MAPVILDPDGSRAQLVLVGGLVIAVGLVALAIVLNSGIYTHNLASRADPIASEAVGNAVVVDDSVEGLVEFAVRDDPNDNDAQNATVEAGVPDISAQLSRESARRGVLTNATVVALFPGTTVRQTADREFSDGASPADPSWEVADDAHGIRDFRMDVDRSSLTDRGLLSFPISSTVFNVTFQTTPDDVVVSVYQDSGTTAVLVTDEATGRMFGPCTDSTGSRTEIDLTGATVAGEHCAALERLGDLPRPYDVEFDGGDRAIGSYSLVANTTETPAGTVGSPGDSGPSGLETLYSVRVDVRFQSHRVDYRTNVTAAPGEPDG